MDRFDMFLSLQLKNYKNFGFNNGLSSIGLYSLSTYSSSELNDIYSGYLSELLADCSFTPDFLTSVLNVGILLSNIDDVRFSEDLPHVLSDLDEYFLSLYLHNGFSDMDLSKYLFIGFYSYSRFSKCKAFYDYLFFRLCYASLNGIYSYVENVKFDVFEFSRSNYFNCFNQIFYFLSKAISIDGLGAKVVKLIELIVYKIDFYVPADFYLCLSFYYFIKSVNTQIESGVLVKYLFILEDRIKLFSFNLDDYTDFSFNSGVSGYLYLVHLNKSNFSIDIDYTLVLDRMRTYLDRCLVDNEIDMSFFSGFSGVLYMYRLLNDGGR